MSNGAPDPFERPPLERRAPDRRAGNFYRSASGDGRALGGIPLDSAEAAMVAAVRMAYKVAEAQIDRSARLARRLREAGDRAVGPRSDRQALDATERLVFRSMMAFLGWVESAASDRSNPLKRLAIAEYRLLGSLLGLSSPEESAAPGGPARDRGGRRPEGPAPAPAAEPEAGPRYPVRIRHAGAERRAVRVCAWEYAGDTSIPATIAVTFYHVEQAHRTPLEGEVAIAGRRAVTLALATPPSAPAGRWRAALCDLTGLQVGSIEIAL